MARKPNTKQIAINVSPAQKNTIAQLAGDQDTNAYIRSLIAADAKRRGITWPADLVDRGKYNRAAGTPRQRLIEFLAGKFATANKYGTKFSDLFINGLVEGFALEKSAGEYVRPDVAAYYLDSSDRAYFLMVAAARRAAAAQTADGLNCHTGTPREQLIARLYNEFKHGQHTPGLPISDIVTETLRGFALETNSAGFYVRPTVAAYFKRLTDADLKSIFEDTQTIG